jgi:hypothetical protein
MPAEKEKSYRLFFWSIILLNAGLLFSCKNEDCISVFNNELLIDFLQADTLASGKIEFHAVDTVFYTIMAVGNDSVFYDSTDVVSSLILPVNPSESSTSFRLQVIDSIRNDTISFDPIIIEKRYYLNPTPHIISISYERRQRIISEDCGTEIAYTNLKIEETTFPSTNLVDNKLSRFNEVNIEILF